MLFPRFSLYTNTKSRLNVSRHIPPAHRMFLNWKKSELFSVIPPKTSPFITGVTKCHKPACFSCRLKNISTVRSIWGYWHALANTHCTNCRCHLNMLNLLWWSSIFLRCWTRNRCLAYACGTAISYLFPVPYAARPRMWPPIECIHIVSVRATLKQPKNGVAHQF